MALSCLGRDSFTKEFTVLLVHALHVSHTSALEGAQLTLGSLWTDSLRYTPVQT
jgi:hypothetical protein